MQGAERCCGYQSRALGEDAARSAGLQVFETAETASKQPAESKLAQ
jgi:hypothetical protein